MYPKERATLSSSRPWWTGRARVPKWVSSVGAATRTWTGGLRPFLLVLGLGLDRRLEESQLPMAAAEYMHRRGVFYGFVSPSSPFSMILRVRTNDHSKILRRTVYFCGGLKFMAIKLYFCTRATKRLKPLRGPTHRYDVAMGCKRSEDYNRLNLNYSSAS